jgi:hypothetical protein
MAAKGFLQHRQSAGFRLEPLHSAHARAIGLNGERQACTRRPAVHLNRAGAADAVLAPNVCTGHAQSVTKEIRQQHAGFGFALDPPAVELKPDAMTLIGPQARH